MLLNIGAAHAQAWMCSSIKRGARQHCISFLLAVQPHFAVLSVALALNAIIEPLLTSCAGDRKPSMSDHPTQFSPRGSSPAVQRQHAMTGWLNGYRDEVVTEAVGGKDGRLPKVPLSKYLHILKHQKRQKQSWSQLFSPAEDPSAAHSSTGAVVLHLTPAILIST